MTAPPESTPWYDAHAGALAPSYEAIDPEQLHEWLLEWLPPAPGLVLDVGAGTGRDAAWLARKGHGIVAVEPSAAMRAEGRGRHPGAEITWVEDQLPALTATYRLMSDFHLILLSGVWQHVLPGERARAMRKLLGLLRSGGTLALSLRHGPPGAGGAMHDVSLLEVERLAREHGAIVAKTVELPDQQGRPGMSWTGVVLRLLDDGTEALPLHGVRPCGWTDWAI